MDEQEQKPVKKLIEELGSDDGVIREKAREALVSMGKRAVDFLAELIESPGSTVRWEATKALGQIADKSSAPVLVIALYDDDYEVRWLATEGLIKIGVDSVKPILEALAETPGSLSLREGAHHVLHDLEEKNVREYKNEIRQALDALESADPEDEVLVVARRLLDTMK
jgi:HEAT repeat protein